MALLKDDRLVTIARTHNVAQFVSFGPDLSQRHSCIRSLGIDCVFPTMTDAVSSLMTRSPRGMVNVRTFRAQQDKGLPFTYGLDHTEDVVARVEKDAAAGLYTLVNETIDVHDGGVSGVGHAGIIEFAPDDTPRCVEKPGVVALPWRLSRRLLLTIYRVDIGTIGQSHKRRVEFSVHPLRCGFRNSQLIYWEEDEIESTQLRATLIWPNNFSRKLGDKAFGLVVAATIGLRVPKTIVIPRSIAPFIFGDETTTSEEWVRTCPSTPEPGKFATARGWVDPFELMNCEDPDGSRISSVLAQAGVAAKYSGATLPLPRGRHRVEGVIGFGDQFMLGREEIDALPDTIVQDVTGLVRTAEDALRCRLRAEWAHDGEHAWVLQMHQAALVESGFIIYPGDPLQWIEFDPADGVDALQRLIKEISGRGTGILVKGQIGITSHVGDLLRRSCIPSRILSPSSGLQEHLFSDSQYR